METKRKLKLCGYFVNKLSPNRNIFKTNKELVFKGNFSCIRVPSVRRVGKVMADSKQLDMFIIRHNILAYLYSIVGDSK